MSTAAISSSTSPGPSVLPPPTSPAPVQRMTTRSQAAAAAEKVKQHTQSERQRLLQYFVAGGCAGAASRTVVSPLERLKILQQVQSFQGGQYTGIWQGLCKIWREEGFKGMMRGNGINCLRIAPYSAVQFASYEQLKKLFSRNNTHTLNTPERLTAGALAGIASVATTYPLDLVRSRLSIASASLGISGGQASAQEKLGMWSMGLKVYREEGGVRGLYRGLVATSVGVAPYVALNFAAYESLKGFFPTSDPASATGTAALSKLACGALAGTISQTLTYPCDVLRRKMQVVGMKSAALGPQYDGAWDAVIKIVKAEGFFGLYRGIWANWLKVAPSIGVSFYTYELVRDLLESVA